MMQRAYLMGSTDDYRETLRRKITACKEMTGALEDWLRGPGSDSARLGVSRRLSECLHTFLTADLEAQLETLENFQPGPGLEDLAEAQRHLDALRGRQEIIDRMLAGLNTKGLREVGEMMIAGLFPEPIEQQVAAAERELSEIQRAIEAKLPPK